MIQDIIDGQCPQCSHVSEAPEEYAVQTSVTALHIATAVNTKQAVEQNNKHKLYTALPSVFSLKPYMVATAKKHHEILDLIFKKAHLYRHCSIPFITCNKSVASKQLITTEMVTFPEFCVLHDDIASLEMAFKHAGAEQSWITHDLTAAYVL